MTVATDDLQKAIEKLRAKHGEDIFRKGNEFDDPPRISTGMFALDAITGGGIPTGRITQLYGQYSSGKTMLGWKIAAEAQRMGLSVAYYDLENQFDKDWIRGLGANPDDVQVVDTNVIDVIGDALEAYMEPINLHIIDSVAAGITREEQNTDFDEYRMAPSSRLWDKVIRRANAHFKKDRNTIIYINQAREVFGKQGIERPWGGRQLQHMTSVTLGINKSSLLYKDKKGNLSKDGIKENPETGVKHPAGMEIVIKVEKARKMNVQEFASCRVRLEYGDIGTFDEAWNITRAAIFNGLVEKSGSWYTLPDGERVQGENQLKQYVLENQDFANMVRRKVLDR